MRRALLAEWTKLRTLPSNVAMLLAVTVAGALGGVHAARIAAVALAAAAVCGEFQPRLIRVTLAMSPRRYRVFAAKALVVGGAVLVTAAVAAGRLGCPAVLNLALAALFTVGIAATVRHAGGAVGIAVTALYGPYLSTVLVPMPARTVDRILDWSPMSGGLTVIAAYAAGALLIGGTSFTVRDA